MKNLFSVLLLSLFLSVSLMGQHQGPALTGFVLETAFGANSVVNDSTFQVNCFHPASQLGFGYDATDIQVGHYGLDALNRLFRVDAIVGVPTFGTSVLRLVELQDNNLPPVGVCVIYEEIPGTNLIPMGVVDGGINGLTFPTGTKIFNHNIRELNRLIEEIPIESDSTRLESGILVSWKNGAIVRRDTMYAAYSRIEDIGNVFVAADNVEEGLAENGSNIAANTLLISAVKDALGIGFLDEDFGNFINPILPDNADGKAIYEALADAISAIPTPTLSSVLSAGNNASGGSIEDLQLLSFGDGTVINPVYLYDNSGELVLGKSGQVDDLFEFNDDFDSDISVVRKENLNTDNIVSTPFGLVTSTILQGQLEQIVSLIPGVSDDGNVLFVSQGVGDNSTAKVGNIVFPFKDPWAARDTAEARAIVTPTIIILDGSFSWCTTGTCTKQTSDHLDLSFSRDGFTYYSFNGVTYSDGNISGLINQAGPLGDMTGGNSWRFLGESTFILNSGVLAFWAHPNVDVEIQAKSLNYSPNAKSAFQVRSRSNITGGTGGAESVKIDIEEVNLSNNARFFGLFAGNVADTVFFDLSINIQDYSGLGANAFFVFDPFYFQGDIILNIDNCLITGNAGFVETNRCGLLNSFFSVDIGNMFIDNLPSVEYNLEYSSTHGSQKQSANSVKSFRVANLRGPLTTVRTNNSFASGGLLTKYDISGTNTYEGVMYNIRSAAGRSWEISGNLKTDGDLVSIQSTNDLTLLDLVAICEGVPITTTSARTDTIFVLNSLLTSPNAVVSSGVVPVKSLNSTISPYPGSDYDVSTERLLGHPIWIVETFTATAAQTDFTVSLSKLPADGANVRVYDDTGAKLRKTDHYTYVAATGTVTLVTPATAGEKYVIEYYQ